MTSFTAGSAFLAAAYLHRLGVSHRALTPAAILSRPDGSLASPTCPNGGTAGPYSAELIHDAAAASAAGGGRQLLLGVIVAELLVVPPRWNASMGRVEDAATSVQLAPPRAPADGAAADAWALCAALCASPPAASHPRRRSPLAALCRRRPFRRSRAVARPAARAVLRAAAAGRVGVPSARRHLRRRRRHASVALVGSDLLSPPPSPTPSPAALPVAAAADAMAAAALEALPVAAPASGGGGAQQRQRHIIVRDGGGASLVELH